MSNTPAILLFGYGNPGRGDDGLGPALIEAMLNRLSDQKRLSDKNRLPDKNNLGDVECLTDMQLQIEHVTDLLGRERILFIDADMSCEQACSLRPLQSKKDDSYTSHAMSPEALMYTYQQVYGDVAPTAFTLSIRAYQFELGADLCEQARQNLCLAIQQVEDFCKR